MFSVMALPAQLLDRLPPGVGILGEEPQLVLPIELGEVGSALPGGGLLRGGVVQLAVQGGAAFGTTLALAACRAAQQEALRHGGELAWCAFVDPSRTLHAPGVVRAGVALERLLVVRPGAEQLQRVAVRLAESRAFAVLVVDAVGVPGCFVEARTEQWPRLVRRLALAVEGTALSVLFITESGAVTVPLPVAQRLELSRPAPELLRVRVAKDRRGRVGLARTVSLRPVSPREARGCEVPSAPLHEGVGS